MAKRKDKAEVVEQAVPTPEANGGGAPSEAAPGTKPHLEWLKADGYRGLRNLHLQDLGTVNVFVGANNSGKTSVLEAVRLLAAGDEREIQRIQEHRLRKLGYAEKNPLMTTNSEFESGQPDWVFRSSKGQDRDYKMMLSGYLFGDIMFETLIDDHKQERKIGEQRFHNLRNSSVLYYPQRPPGYNEFLSNRYNSNYRDSCRIEFLDVANTDLGVHHLIDEVALKSSGEVFFTLESLLRQADPSILRVQPLTPKNKTELFLMSNGAGLLPLTSYGDGFQRLIRVGLAVHSAIKGILLIDEFETAVHHSNLRLLLRWLLKARKELDIQLFLTSHNLEALDVLVEVAREVGEEGVVFYRLEQTPEQTKNVRFTMSEIETLRYRFGMEIR